MFETGCVTWVDVMHGEGGHVAFVFAVDKGVTAGASVVVAR